MRMVDLPGSEAIPVLGLGTWRMGEVADRFDVEVAAVRHAFDRGIRLFDTAEMYGEGGAERVLGDALRDLRDECFLVSKVYPHNAGRDDAIAACERSLRRLGTDVIDLYLLHWQGSVPYAETIEAFEALRRDGKIRYYGVSNFDADDMADWFAAGGENSVTNQVIYNPSRRGIEYDLIPWCRDHALPVMAYSPLEQGRLANHAVLHEIAERHGATPLQIALAWVLRDPLVVAIPKSIQPGHIDRNLAAMGISLDERDLAAIDAAFPPPTSKQPLEIL